MPKFVVEFGKAANPAEPDGRLDAPAFHRNHDAIWTAIAGRLGETSGDVLEIGSGTGQHAVTFASQLASITWWPTDFNGNHVRSIEAWRVHSGLGNVKPPIRFDASAADWKLVQQGLPSTFTAIFCANVIHISPWAVAEGLFAGAGRHLEPGGLLLLYGPFKRNGAHNAPSNAAFDESLRTRDPSWGVRDTSDLRALAERNNLRFVRLDEMPSNNAIMIFQRA